MDKLNTINKQSGKANAEIKKLQQQIVERGELLEQLDLDEATARREYAIAELDGEPSAAALKKLSDITNKRNAAETVVQVANERIEEQRGLIIELNYSVAEARGETIDVQTLAKSTELVEHLWRVIDLSKEIGGLAWQASTLDNEYKILQAARGLKFLNDGTWIANVHDALKGISQFYPRAYDQKGRRPS